MSLKVKMLSDEHWWGGTVLRSEEMPFDENTETVIDLVKKRGTLQSAPLFLSDKGRYIWSEKGFEIKFSHGEITCEGEAEIVFNEDGSTLRDAYLNARKDRFAFAEDVRTPREFYEFPQFNTWMELIKNQAEENILAYAEELVANGYGQGILIIDDGWQRDHGVWRFDAAKFKDPKGMIEKLHSMGFKVMLWVSPYLSPDSDEFNDMTRIDGVECDTGHLVRLNDGRVAVYKWWNGFSAMLDFTSAADVEYMQNQLDILVNDYGVDGFKFDGGDYTMKPVNAEDTDICPVDGDDPSYEIWRNAGGVTKTTDELNEAWIKFGVKYYFHEYKNTWKSGKFPVIQRLVDKSHVWGKGGLASLIPQTLFIGLAGNPFVCPDMVGGGRWITFLYGDTDEELFVRMAQCSALFPMMQFSALPWRKLSPKYAELCLKVAKIHESVSDYIIEEVRKSEKSGEPLVRSMEYAFPNSGYAKINDQFMLGDKYLVAPVFEKGATKRKVVFPKGEWVDTTDGKVYAEGISEVSSPIEKLPYFINAAYKA